MARSKYQIYLFVCALSFTVLAAGCARQPAQPKEPPKQETASGSSNDTNLQQKVLAFNLEGLSEKGEKKWEVQGQSAEALSEDEIKLNDIVAKSYGEEGEATLTADKGIYYKAKNNVLLEENVKAVIENERGFAKDRIDLPGLGVGDAYAGKDQEDRKKTKTVITCDAEAVFDYEKNLAYFNKNVKVRSTEGDMDADKMTVNLDTSTKRVKDIVAEGNVVVKQGENTTYSDKAIYSEVEKKVTLIGNPRLVIYQEGDVEENFLKGSNASARN